MPVTFVHARLSTQDREDLLQCLEKLNNIHDSVKATGMTGKPSILGQCVEIYRVIERVLAKEIAAVKRWKERSGLGADQDEPTENGARDPGEQARPGESERAQPG